MKEDYPEIRRRVYKAFRATLTGGLTCPLVNTPVRVNLPTKGNFLFVSRPLIIKVVPGCRVTIPVNVACKPGLCFALQLELTPLVG